MSNERGAPAGARSPSRILFLPFEGGTGIGHLRRVARVAAALERRHACLIVTSHREVADWFVSPRCEYVRLPGWDGLVAERAAYWGREPFLAVSVDEAVALRKRLLRGVVEAYAPDLLVVDHLPLGMHGELEDVVREAPCRKYLLTRGVLNRSGKLLDLVLGGAARDCLRDRYDRIVVAADPRVVDFARDYGLPAELAGKTVHVGYVADPVSAGDVAAFRAQRGADGASPWVVVSAGGGQLGEGLIRRAVALAADHPGALFDVVAGPRSSLPADLAGRHAGRANLRVHAESRHMPMLNASADVVVCSGGYNTLVEALQGRARILCVPSWTDPRDEQTQHALGLQGFADVTVVPEAVALGPALAAALAGGPAGRAPDRRGAIDLSGAQAIARLIEEDLRGA